MRSIHKALYAGVLTGVFAIALRGIALAPARADAPFPPIVRVGNVVVVSAKNPNVDHAEMLGAADPSNPLRMFACTSAFLPSKNARVDIVYATYDGGQTWTPQYVHTFTRYVGDPACAYGINHSAWFSSLSLSGGPHDDMFLHLFRSGDNGLTWQRVARRGFMDREYLTVDRTGGPYNGTVYLYAHDVVHEKHKKKKVTESYHESVQLMRYAHGRLLPPVHFAQYAKYTSTIPLEGVVTLHGTLVIPFAGNDPKESELSVTSSHDGGLTLTKPVLVAKYKPCARAFFALAPLAIDRSEGPFRDNLYLAWDDYSTGRCLINISRSNNEGKTWSDAIVLHDDNPRVEPDRTMTASSENAPDTGPDEMLPTLAVSNEGVIGLSWYDTRDDAKNQAMRLRFAISDDGGESFAPSMALSQGLYDDTLTKPFYLRVEGGSDKNGLTSSVQSHDAGEYDDLPGHTRDMLADAKGVLHPFWFENQTGIPQLLTEPISISGRAWSNGDPSLAGLDDITKDVSLRYLWARYDAGTDTMTLRAIVVNHSKSRVTPMKMRMLWAQASHAHPIPANAANSFSGPGAIWDMSEAVGNGSMKPWSESSGTMTFEFSMRSDGKRPAGPPDLNFEARVFGKAVSPTARHH